MLKAKVALITGSTSGIGLGIARGLAQSGAHIVLNGFGDRSEIEELRAGIQAASDVEVIYNAADMSKPDEIVEMITETQKTLGSVDIVVNNAGSQKVAPIEEFSGGQVGCDHRHQSLLGVSHHPHGDPAHEGPGLGPHCQHRLRP
jgi:3-hydroxybutyrate dehydrogenase